MANNSTTNSTTFNMNGTKIDKRLATALPFLGVSFTTFGRITVSLPLGALAVCFVTAMLFSFDEVNPTMCGVQNSVPSISAITGVSPQQYLWRICIALHSTPRLLIGYLYYKYYISQINSIEAQWRSTFRQIVKVACWCYTVENACLIGTAYISNRENYPLHEKLFVVFMVVAVVYEILATILFSWCHRTPQSPLIAQSKRAKQACLVAILLFTLGLVYFFLRHRFHCEPYAFTGFAVCEYGIAVVNILYHYTATCEFEDSSFLVTSPAAYPPLPPHPVSSSSISTMHNGTTHYSSYTNPAFSPAQPADDCKSK